MKKLMIYILGVSLLYGLSACKDEVTIPVGFEKTSGKAVENDSTYTVRINLGKSTNGATITFAIAGNAALDGDYILTQGSSTDQSGGDLNFYQSSDSVAVTSLTVSPGRSYVDISFKLIDDTYLEPNLESLYFVITGISDESISNALQNYIYKFTITDNDTPPTDGLQVDLSWGLGDGMSINQADFDLYLARNVTFTSGGSINSKELVAGVSSVNPKGFESFKISQSLPDDDYYVIVHYTSGSKAATMNLILSKDRTYSRGSGRASSTSVGKDFYYGPVTKAGSKFSRTTSAEPRWFYP